MKNRRFVLIAAMSGLVFVAASPAWSYVTFLDNGPSSNRVDAVFLGDGYTASELGTYQSHIDSMMKHLFDDGQDPFPRYRSYFNAHRIDVISNQSGADDPTAGRYVKTALDATYRYDGVTQRLLYINETKANAALAAGLGGAIAADMRFVAVNDTQYGGGGGRYAVWAGGNSAATEIALHELGHSFAGLADEYQGISTPYTGPEPGEPNVTKDPTGAKWSRWLGYDQPGIGIIGAFEGARYYDKGLFRPSFDSKMRSLGKPFDAVSREEIILDLYRIVDPLDAWLSDIDPLLDPVNLWVDSISSDIIQIQWFVDDIAVSGAFGEVFNPLDFDYGPGTYTVRAHSFDPTGWVRRDLDLLQQDISWIVTYSSIPEPATVAIFGTGLFWGLAGLGIMGRKRAV